MTNTFTRVEEHKVYDERGICPVEFIDDDWQGSVDYLLKQGVQLHDICIIPVYRVVKVPE